MSSTWLASQLVGGDFIPTLEDADAIIGNYGKSPANFGIIYKSSTVKAAKRSFEMRAIRTARSIVAGMILYSCNETGELPDFYHNYLIDLGWEG